MRACKLVDISALRLRGSSRVQLVIEPWGCGVSAMGCSLYLTVVKSVLTVSPAVLHARYKAGR